MTASTLRSNEGEIHALVGENGAGKSTLMKILYGLEKPDAGQIFLHEKPVTIPNPQAAIRLGIDMVHQHFQLVPSLSVAENVTLGYEPHRGPLVDRADDDRRACANYPSVLGSRSIRPPPCAICRWACSSASRSSSCSTATPGC